MQRPWKTMICHDGGDGGGGFGGGGDFGGESGGGYGSSGGEQGAGFGEGAGEVGLGLGGAGADVGGGFGGGAPGAYRSPYPVQQQASPVAPVQAPQQVFNQPPPPAPYVPLAAPQRAPLLQMKQAMLGMNEGDWNSLMQGVQKGLMG